VGHVSFVRDWQGRVSFEDHKLRALIDASTGPGKRWSAVDVVMQQCFSGGFIGDIVRDGRAAATVTTAADWNQVSWTVQEKAGFDKAVLNFTAAWVQAAAARPDAGLRELAFRARAADWTAEAFYDWVKVQPTFPQFGSRDAQPGGANDLRTLSQKPGERIFTATAVFGPLNGLAVRHVVNAARVQQLMIGRTAAAQTAYLFDQAGSTVNLGNEVYRLDTAALPKLTVTGSTSTAGVQSVLDGSAFAGEARAGDRLLLYTTGHGADAYFVNNRVQSTRSSDGGAVDGWRMQPTLTIDPNAVGSAGQTSNAPFAQREVGGYASDSFNPDMFGDRDDVGDGRAEIQLSFSAPLGPTTRFAVNGVDFTGSARRLVTGIRNLPDRDADTRTPTPVEVWQIDVPFDLINVPTGPVFDITGLDPETAADVGRFFASSIWYGDRENLIITTPAPVPEPATWALWLLGACGVASFARRRSSGAAAR
jgi:hypothetical protein